MKRFPIEHCAELPCGFRVEFRFEAPDNVVVSFTPAPGPIANARARRRLLAAYALARGEFLQTVATAIGGNVAVIDIERGNVTGFTVTSPAVRH